MLRPCLILFAVLLFSTGLASPGQSAQSAQSLAQDKPVERQMAGGEVHSYQIPLVAGQYLHAVVDQRGIDVVVTLFTPDDRKIAEVDSPNGTQGPEPLWVIANITGTHRLEIRSLEKTATAGRYEVRIVEKRRATLQDKNRIAAEQSFKDGEQLREKADADSLRNSIVKYEQALKQFRMAADRAGQLKSLSSTAAAHNSLSDRKKAIDTYNQALKLLRAGKERRQTVAKAKKGANQPASQPNQPSSQDAYTEANLLFNIAADYYALEESEKALDYYNQALPIYRSINDREDEAVTINNIGLIYHKKSNDVQKAMEYYNQALAIWSTLPGRLEEASTLNNIGTLHHDKGEYQQALDYYNQSLIIRRKLGDRSSEIIPLNQIGNTYEALGEKEKAFEKYNQALDIAKAEGNRFVEATLLNNLGSAYAQKDDNQKALDYYNRALLLKRSMGDKYGEAQVLHNIARTYDSLNERQKSLDHYNQALAIWRAISNRFGESSTLSLLGDLCSRAGDKQKARDYLNQALTLKRAIGDRKGEAATLHYLARALRDSDDLAAARIHIEAALKIIESLRANIGNREFRASYFASVRNYYDFYIDLLMRLDERAPAEGHAAEALRASEGARARNLLEMLAEARGNISRGIDPALAERQRTLERQLNIKTELQIRLLNDQHADERDNALNKEIESLLAQYQEVETQIRMKSPHYADLALPQPLSLSQIQQQVLDSDTLLLEYALGDERSYLWAVTKTSITGHALPRRAEIESAARRFYELLNEPNQQLKAVDVKKKERAVRTATQSRDIEEAASALSRMLIEPVAEQLGKKRLLMVSEGALQYIPFTALAALQTKNSEFRPLILDHEIVNLPSASTLAVIRRETGGRKPAAKTVVVLADPVFDSQDERVKKAEPKPDGRKKKDGTKIDDRALKVKVEKPVIETAAVEAGVTDSRLQIPRLPGTRTEAKKILELASSSERAHALDFQASRAAATDPSLNQYRFIHFATHGFLNSVHPELSGIVLSLVDERGARQDGFLLANEFYNLKLPAELVVLSACQSGLGKEIKGEGVVGLTRGLMYAGAARVIVSLWSVDDEATSELMVNLYKGILKKGMRPAEALRAAQIKMWEQTKWQAPYYWAAFVLQGEWK